MDATQREKVRFCSGRDDCVAWYYPGHNGACVVMGSGAGVTKEPGTDRFAARINEAGFAVLAFDFRHFGESGGRARQVLKIRRQLADWKAALAWARARPEIDQVMAWGFSLAGGHLLRLARRQPLAATIAQTPLADGLAAMPNALRHESLAVVLGFPFIALTDLVGALFRCPPLLVPLAAERGKVAMLTTPDAQDADRALNPGNLYPEWRQVIAARSVMKIGGYRPGRGARRVRCPLLVVVADDDQSVLARPALRVAERAPGAELLRVSGGHYAPFLAEHSHVVEVEIDFLNRHLTASAPRDSAEGRRPAAARPST